MNDQRDEGAFPGDGPPPPPSPPPAVSPPVSPAPAESPQQDWLPVPSYPPDQTGRSTWSPPGQGNPPGPGGVPVTPPPPPPSANSPRRRWLIVVLGVVVAAVLAIPVVLALGWFPTQTTTVTADDPVAEDTPESGTAPPDGDTEGSADTDVPEDDTSDGDAGNAQGEVDPDQTPPEPDVESLEGTDAAFAEVLSAVNESELVMIGFQEDIADVFGADSSDPAELNSLLSEASADHREALIAVRRQLDQPTDDDDAEAVREAYLDHLDSWGEYMTAIEDNPGTLLGEGRDGGYTVVINATADAFARTLEDRLPAGIDTELADLAGYILQRGFSGSVEAQV